MRMIASCCTHQRPGVEEIGRLTGNGLSHPSQDVADYVPGCPANRCFVSERGDPWHVDVMAPDTNIHLWPHHSAARAGCELVFYVARDVVLRQRTESSRRCG